MAKIILGSNRFGAEIDDALAGRIMAAADHLGLQNFDTAQHYAQGRSEELIGSFVRGRRSRFQIGTKFGYSTSPSGVTTPDAGRGSDAYIRRAVEASLTRLRTDYLDTLAYHVFDDAVPVEETVGSLSRLVEEGKIRQVSACSLSVGQVLEFGRAAHSLHAHKLKSVHYEYSLLNRKVETELVPALKEIGSSLVAFFPLAAGMLTGKYIGRSEPGEGRLARNDLHRNKFYTAENIAMVASINDLANQLDRTMLELALGWLDSKTYVTGIVCGVSSVEQLGALDAARKRPLTDPDLARLETAARVVES